MERLSVVNETASAISGAGEPDLPEDLGQCNIDGICDLVDVVRCCDQCRAKAQRVVPTRNGAVGHADDHTLRSTFSDNFLRVCFCHRFFGLAIRDQFTALEQAFAAHITDDAVLFHECM